MYLTLFIVIRVLSKHYLNYILPQYCNKMSFSTFGNLNLAVLRGLRLSAFCCGSNISAKVQILWCTLD